MAERMPGPDRRPILDSELDPSGFHERHNSARWTGIGNIDEPNDFIHVDVPGRSFRREEVPAERLAEIEKRAENKRMETSRRTDRPFPDPSEIVSERGTSGSRSPETSEQGPKWKNLDSKNYIGVEVKTLESILKNPREQQFFGEMLAGIDSSMVPMLAKAMGGEKLDDNEREFLRYGIYEFSKWYPRAEAVAARIQPKDVELASRRNSGLDTDVALRGKERVAELFKTEAVKLAMRDPARFQDLEKAYKALNDAQSTKRYQIWEKRVHDLCDRMGIKPRDYTAVFDLSEANKAKTRQELQSRTREEMGTLRKGADTVFSKIGFSKADRLMDEAYILNLQASGVWRAQKNRLANEIGLDPKDYDEMFTFSRGKMAEKRQKVKEHVRANMGGFRKATDFALGLIGRSKGDRVMRYADELNVVSSFFGANKPGLFERVNQNLEIISGVMAQTISGNPILQQMIEQEAFTGTNKQLSEDVGPRTFQEAGAKHAEISSEASVVARFKEDIKNYNVGGRTWNELEQHEREEYRNSWDPTPKGAVAEGRGFWARVIMSFIKSFWKNPERRNKLPIDNI